MAMIIGSKDADSGLSKEIYDVLNQLLSQPFADAVNKSEGDRKAAAQKAWDEARQNWKIISFAISNGVINHIQQNMDIVNPDPDHTIIHVKNTTDNETPPQNNHHQHEVAHLAVDVEKILRAQ